MLVPLALSEVAAASDHAVRDFAGLTMGTTWSVKCVLPDESDPALGQADAALRVCIQSVLDVVIEQMSTWHPDSALSRYNRAPPRTWHTLPEECFHVLRYALAIAAASDGACDPTAGPLVNLWGFGPEPHRASRPTDAAIAMARARVGWQRVEVQSENRRVYQPGGIYLDFSAIAKGYAVDLVARCLTAAGVTHHLVEIGGELRGTGVKPDASPWWVRLEDPPEVALETLIALHGLSVATSGDYRKYFVLRRQRFSHTLDPRTGEPIRHGLAAVSVVHPDCIAADALSTALNVMGRERGMEFATERGIAARFVERVPSAPGGCEEALSPSLAALAQ